MELHWQDVLIRPLITEKNTRIMELGQYMFEVHPAANKTIIKEAVERTFNVKVRKVNTMNVRGKVRRRVRRRGGPTIVGQEPKRKKAIVSLEPGYTIDLFSQL
ncbi:50S ribosomal protein L23 [Thermorudis peleae]|uniref:50S ribosomal protein L23 n=1 Tax=Thermorudis peleae TaxID=1382356 RepID=UPI0005703F10|nr:50S ribosomal protein L23 [Thermorudis peleae]MBX6754023.1 50S ribosomal protein L23 [Thermorudis peleae]